MTKSVPWDLELGRSSRLSRRCWRQRPGGDEAALPWTALPWNEESRYVAKVRLMLENLPPSLVPHRATLARCLEAMDRALPLRAVYLFGSHARGDARPDSDVDLCLVAEGAEKQLEAAQQFRRAMRPIHGKPSFTLVPIAPARLAEKKAIGDFFFQTILDEGVILATQN